MNKNHTEVVRKFIQAKRGLDVVDVCGKTVLHHAVSGGEKNIELIEEVRIHLQIILCANARFRW
jgi:hypothetical protein